MIATWVDPPGSTGFDPTTVFLKALNRQEIGPSLPCDAHVGIGIL